MSVLLRNFAKYAHQYETKAEKLEKESTRERRLTPKLIDIVIYSFFYRL